VITEEAESAERKGAWAAAPRGTAVLQRLGNLRFLRVIALLAEVWAPRSERDAQTLACAQVAGSDRAVGWLIETGGREGKNLAAGFSHPDHVLELRGQ
jgi:hypothetical protein